MSVAWRFNRLRLEAMDWSRQVQGDTSDRLTTHRNAISNDPEAWEDA